MRRFVFAVTLFLLVGCSTPGAGSGVTWYNPTTWFSGSAGRESAKIGAQRDTAKDKAIEEAKLSAHETDEALKGVPESRSTDVARDSNDTTVQLLDQATGVPSSKQLNEIKEKVRLLTSELATERAEGEKLRKADQDRVDKLSGRLAELETAKAKADKDLAAAFERENTLANQLRNERWWSWFWRIAIGSAAIIGFAGWVYVRLTLGGLPTALGKSISHLRTSNPAIAEQLTGVLDVNLSPAEQKMIAMISALHR